jgi:hypothetical protein
MINADLATESPVPLPFATARYVFLGGGSRTQTGIGSLPNLEIKCLCRRTNRWVECEQIVQGRLMEGLDGYSAPKTSRGRRVES